MYPCPSWKILRSAGHLLVALLLVSTTLQTADAAVTRGPYLQLGTPTSIVVRWRTDTAENSRVSYGDSPTTLVNTVDDAAPVTEHLIQLTGLQPDTRYYYSIGTDAAVLAGADDYHYFVTSPPTGTSRPTRIWVLGDSGESNPNSRKVRDRYNAFTGSTHTDLWLMLGDNAYPNGTDAQHQAGLFDLYPGMLRKSVLWPSYGNHDADSADSATQTGPYYDIFTLPTNAEAGGVPSGTEAYYSFDYANIHFIVLDSSESDRSGIVTGAVASWLIQDLASTTQDWIIAYWHYAPYSHRSDFQTISQEMRENLVPYLEEAGVDLVLGGHNHSYQRSFLIDGHEGQSDTFDPGTMLVDGGDGRIDGGGAYKSVYDEGSPYRGAVYAVVASSSKVDSQLLTPHPVMYTSQLNYGSLVLDIDGNKLDATFLTASGAVTDYFSIHKNPDNCPAVANPSQTDTDGDGAGDQCDAFPLDPAEQLDTDGDETGNNADLDDDNDGLLDTEEAALGTNPLDPDSDADGTDDFNDAFPLDPAEQLDTDGDGTGNNADLDDDNDGVDDLLDAFPLDPAEQLDTDGDGTGNNADLDDDNDGLLDAEETALGTDPLNPDTDFDGLDDGADPLPLYFNYADGDLAPLGAPDTQLNAGDLVIMMRIVTDQLTPTDLELSHGDIHPPGAPDGEITLPDMLELMKVLLPQGDPPM